MVLKPKKLEKHYFSYLMSCLQYQCIKITKQIANMSLNRKVSYFFSIDMSVKKWFKNLLFGKYPTQLNQID